jgi:hypothetical protein
MSGIFVSKAPLGRPRCARCKRPFKPKKDGDRYGPRCARKLADQVELDSMTLISGKVLHNRKECAEKKKDLYFCSAETKVPPGGLAHLDPEKVSHYCILANEHDGMHVCSCGHYWK